MKYIFKQIDNISRNSAETTVEFSADTLSDVLQQFELFVRGCGFFPPEGNLDYVNDFEEPPEWNTPEWETPKFEPAEELYDEMDYGVANRHRPKNTSPWDWTVNELMKGPVTMHDMGGSFEVNVSSYGAGQPTVSVDGGIDTITLSGLQPGGSAGISCELCGLPRTVMKSHNCYDDNCPKGTWK